MNNHRADISICIPCYNVENYIDSFFECILKQTIKNYNVFIIDDGSTDNTYNLIKKKISKLNLSDNFFLYKQSNNGISETRNRLVNLATGDYIFFMDPDDFIPHDALEKLYNASNNGTIDIITGRAKVQFKNGFTIPFLVQYIWYNNMSSTHFVKSNLTVCWGSLIRTSVLKKYQFLKKYAYEDLGLLNYLYMKTPNFKSIKDVVYKYIRREGSISEFEKKNMWKLIDLYHQTEYAFSLYEKEKWFDSKEMLRIINGTFFQILTATLWFSKKYSNNKYLNKLVLNSLLYLFEKYNLNLHYSKTFWKSLDYFYLKWNYFPIRRKLKNNIKLTSKIEFVTFSNLKNKKNKICILQDDEEIDNKLLAKYNNVSFFTTNDSIKSGNLYHGVKPKKIDDKILENERIYFVDLRNFNNFTNKEIDTIKMINKRILILFNKEEKNKIQDQLNYVFI